MSDTALDERSDADAGASTGTGPGDGSGAVPGEETGAWHTARASVAAVADGVLAALWVLAALAVVCLMGWFSADAGLRWEPRAALRVAADAWALGQGASLVQPWGAVSVVPLGVTLLSVLATRRAGRRVAARAQDEVGDLDVAIAGALVLGGYLVATLVVVVLAGAEETGPSLLRALLGAGAVVVLGAFPALAAGTGRQDALLARARTLLPAWVPGALRRGVAMAGLLLALAALLLGALLLRHAGAGAEAVSALQPSPLDTVVLGIASLLVLPVLVVWAAAWLVGPGVVVGSGTLVSPTVVTLGPLPAVPFTAALPTTGPPSWLVAVQVTPVLVGLGVVLLARRERPHGTAAAIAQAAAAAVVAGVVLAVLGLTASGSVGPGRLGEVGVPVLELFLVSVSALGVGAVSGAGLLILRDRRGGASPAGGSTDEEETVEIVVERHGARAFTPSGWRRVVAPTAGDAGRDGR
ncbi:hypothetical protein KLP28_04690 [Nocardioidaceae bacterium]|nr:hypothetical protein KLP28_04690 [Nocardioidaceae bacterium]